MTVQYFNQIYLLLQCRSRNPEPETLAAMLRACRHEASRR